jgi:hypothetical protein
MVTDVSELRTSETSANINLTTRQYIPEDSKLQYSDLLQTTTGVRSPAEAKNFSSSLCVQTSSEAHPTSYPVGTGGPFPGGNAQPGCDADHSCPSSAEVKTE